MHNFKKMLMSVLGLLMITTLVGCNPTDSKNANKQAADEEKIDKVLQGFERMKNGEIQIVNVMDATRANPREDQSPTYAYERTLTATFDLRPDRILGKFTNESGIVSDVYYEDFDMYFKDETQQIWYKDKYGIKNYEKPVGINRDAVAYFRTVKDQFTIAEDKDTITIHFQNSNLKFLGANSDLLIGPANEAFHFSSDHANGELNMDLTVSKEGYIPLSIVITCTGKTSNYAKYKMISKVTYSNINSGISVEAPSGIENAIEQYRGV